MKHLSLFELNQLVGDTLNKHLAPSYWVVAEIGEMRVNQKGHCYLELVEKQEEKLLAKARATIWAYNFSNLSTWFFSITGQPLQPGLKILANVQVQHHELYGLSLNIRDIDPNYTLGEKEKKRQQVIARLMEEGVFEMNKTLALPPVPQKIAIISSPSAAGYEDFVNQLQNNPYGYKFYLVLYKAIMQGKEAIPSLIDALHRIHDEMDGFDLVAIIRGGGSQVDFDCFDSYELASHVAQFPLPVVTGIGHERDESVTDMVAHTKLKTPTAVAEFLIQGVQAFEEQLINLLTSLVNRSREMIVEKNNKLVELNYQIYSKSKDIIFTHKQHLENIKERLLFSAKKEIQSEGNKLDIYQQSMQLLDPVNTLKRGYTITSIGEKLLKNCSKVPEGTELKTVSSKFEIISLAKEIVKHNGQEI